MKSLPLLLLCVVITGWAATPHAADEAAIKSQLSAYSASRQTGGDGHAQAVFFTEDADEWGSGAKEMSKGREAIAKTLTEGPDPTRRFRVEPVNYDFLAKDIVVVDALYYGAATESLGRGVYVMVKRNGKWLIRSARISRLAPPGVK